MATKVSPVAVPVKPGLKPHEAKIIKDMLTELKDGFTLVVIEGGRRFRVTQMDGLNTHTTTTDTLLDAVFWAKAVKSHVSEGYLRLIEDCFRNNIDHNFTDYDGMS